MIAANIRCFPMKVEEEEALDTLSSSVFDDPFVLVVVSCSRLAIEFDSVIFLSF